MGAHFFVVWFAALLVVWSHVLVTKVWTLLVAPPQGEIQGDRGSGDSGFFVKRHLFSYGNAESDMQKEARQVEMGCVTHRYCPAHR